MTSTEIAPRLSYVDWNLPYGCLEDTYTEEQARERDATGQEYWVLFGEPTAPQLVIHVAERHVWHLVVWLDHLRRRTFSYLFVPGTKYGRDNTVRFLEQARTLTFEDETEPPQDVASSAQTDYFKPDGSVYSARGGKDHPSEESRTTMPADEADRILWEPTPTFGNWTSITRYER